MRMYWRGGVVLMMLLAVGLSGCRRAEVVAEPEPEDTTHLGDTTDLVVADWLTWPRAKLAREVKETFDTAAAQQQKAREAAESGGLLPKLRPVVAAPVFAGAKFSAKTEFSLPPYFKEGTHDADLALHLARFGDHEAALRLADPADKELRRQLDGCAAGRNYPVEWTQLVGLHLQLAQLKLAHGSAQEALEGATELVLLHKQLVELLDPKAAAGPLGTVLLSGGRAALSEAATAWRDGAQKKPALAADVDAALKDWGAVPDPFPAVLPGARADAVARVMGGDVRGRAVVAQTENAVRRSLDLLGLPVVHESVQAVLAFLDTEGQLVEFLFLYKEGTTVTFPEPIDLARHLSDLGFRTSEATTANGLPHQSFTGGGLVYDVSTTPRSSALGSIVRVGVEKAPAAKAPGAESAARTRDPRDFGALHLDRSFERNRTGVAPEVGPDKKITITRPDAVASVTTPVTDPKPAAVVVERKGEHDLVESVSVRWSAERGLNLVAVSNLVVPLLAAYGPPRIESVEDTARGYLAFVWENAQTRLTLRLPYDTAEGPELKAVDRRGEDVKDRLTAAAKFDRDERAARWQSGKPLTRLGRGLPGAGVDQVHLGQDKAEVRKLLAAASESRLTAMTDGGFNLLFFSTPAVGVTYWPRQVFVRFDKEEHVVEVRVRYENGLVPPTKDRPALFDLLKKINGAPEKLAPTWPGVWADLPGGKAATHFRWLDDRTLVTFQQDAATTEVTVRDCPADGPRGADVPPLSFCSRGLKGRCELGDRRADVLKRWNIAKPTLVGDAVLLAPAEGPFDALLVYFEAGDEGKAVKIQGQYRKRQQGSDASPAIQEAWRDDLDHLGSVRRQDGAAPPLLQASSCWHDDRTRVRIFGQQTETGPRLYCEWRELPIPAKR